MRTGMSRPYRSAGRFGSDRKGGQEPRWEGAGEHGEARERGRAVTREDEVIRLSRAAVGAQGPLADGECTRHAAVHALE